MHTRERASGYTNAKLLGVDEAAARYSIGRGTVRKYAETVGAIRKIGSRVLIDRATMDAAIDAMAAAR